MFDHMHYVPILKTKAGERWALQHTEFKLLPHMTPVLEFHHPNKKKDKHAKPIEKHIPELCGFIKEAWGTASQFFLDTEYINNAHGPAWALNTALEACRDNGLKAIPVIKIGYDDLALDTVKSAVNKDKRGYMLRLDFEDAGAQSTIGRVVDYLGLKKRDAHLLLDYRKEPMNLAEDVTKLPSLNDWMTFTAASAAFPKTISTLPQRTWIPWPRDDWNAWEESVTKHNLSRKPAFGDHATRCDGPPAGGGDPPVHLRYTKEKNWLVYMDGSFQTGGAQNIRLICQNLIAKPEYDGRDFSRGDWDINLMAHRETGSGTPKQWLQWCLNHHFAYAIQQILGHSGI